MIRLVVFVLACSASAIVAGEPLRIYGGQNSTPFSPYANLNLTEEQLAAAQDLEAAQFRFVQAAYFEWPARLRAIDADIAVAEAQAASFARREAEFGRFAVWTRGGNALFETLEDVRLTAFTIDRQLALLRQQRADLLQQQPFEYRLLQTNVERARARLRALQ